MGGECHKFGVGLVGKKSFFMFFHTADVQNVYFNYLYFIYSYYEYR